RRAFADFSPAVPAAFAAGLGVSLWIFLLPAGVVQKGPTPVLPAFGGAAGRVVADLPVPAGGRASEVRTAASAHSKLVVARTQAFVPRRRPPVTTARRVHHQVRTGVMRRAPSALVRAVAPAAPKTRITRSRLFSISPTAKGKAFGRARGHAPKPEEVTPAPLPPGRGQAVGRSKEHEDRLARRRAKESPAAAAGLPSPPKGNGGGNGRNHGGNGRKWEKN